MIERKGTKCLPQLEDKEALKVGSEGVILCLPLVTATTDSSRDVSLTSCRRVARYRRCLPGVDPFRGGTGGYGVSTDFIFPRGYLPTAVAVGDLNRDGVADLAVVTPFFTLDTAGQRHGRFHLSDTYSDAPESGRRRGG